MEILTSIVNVGAGLATGVLAVGGAVVHTVVTVVTSVVR